MMRTEPIVKMKFTTEHCVTDISDPTPVTMLNTKTDNKMKTNLRFHTSGIYCSNFHPLNIKKN